MTRVSSYYCSYLSFLMMIHSKQFGEEKRIRIVSKVISTTASHDFHCLFPFSFNVCKIPLFAEFLCSEYHFYENIKYDECNAKKKKERNRQVRNMSHCRYKYIFLFLTYTCQIKNKKK